MADSDASVWATRQVVQVAPRVRKGKEIDFLLEPLKSANLFILGLLTSRTETDSLAIYFSSNKKHRGVELHASWTLLNT